MQFPAFVSVPRIQLVRDLFVRMASSIPHWLQLCLHALLLLQPSPAKAPASDLHRGSTAQWKAVGANKWQSFDSWNPNTPAGRRHAAATAILNDNINGKPNREMMLMYGGMGSVSDETTWIYDLHSNSWESTRRLSGPPGIVHHTLVTLCQRRVLLFGGYTFTDTTGNKQCNNETWMFDVTRKEWRLVETVIHYQSRNSYVTPRCRHTATVVRSENSSCICKESMFIYSGLPNGDDTWSSNMYKGIGDSWLLTCKNDSSRLYEWVRLDPVEPKLSHPGAVSAFNNTTVYLLGAALPYNTSTGGRNWQVWSYHLSTATWRMRNNSTHQKSTPGQAIYINSEHHSHPYHFLLSCCSQPLTVFDMTEEKWFSAQQTGRRRSVHQGDSTITNIGGNLLFFGMSAFVMFGKSPAVMWCLTVNSSFPWHWSELRRRRSNPLKGRLFGVGGFMQNQNEVLLFSGMRQRQDSTGSQSDNGMYRLDLTTLKWSVEITERRPPGAILATGTVLLSSVLIVYGGWLMNDSVKVYPFFVDVPTQTEAWGYYNQVRTWLRYSLNGAVPPKRLLHATVAKDARTMMLYGGVVLAYGNYSAQTVIRRDLWSFTLPPMKKDTVDLSDQALGAQWHLLDQSGPDTSYLASLVTIKNTLYLYGGSGSILTVDNILDRRSTVATFAFNCSNNLWRYNLSDRNGWEKVQYEGSGPGYRCMHDAVPYGDRMLILGGFSNRVSLHLNLATLLSDYNWPGATSVWVYDPLTISWLQLSSEPIYQGGIAGSAMFVWNELILSFCGLPIGSLAFDRLPSDWMAFSFYKPGCPPGTTSTDLRTHMCSDCPKGFYSPTPRSNCSACPDGLTTSKAHSTDQQQCNQCLPDYCRHGSCTVTPQILTPRCTCKGGYTRDANGLCTIPSYYYIGASACVAGIALLVLVFLLVAKLVAVWKRHNITLRNKEHELMELTNTWNIDSREVRLRQRIDRDSPGGYGEVYKAEYREITVAVKRLKGIHQNLNRIELEFEREIEVMKTIRHPNIVLFLGGGRYHDDSCPFLVVEYMPRGSLVAILRNEEIDLEDSVKIRFAIDAAKGMRFLHSLRPPRIHRDLKSGNLLVSRRWVVKVADFGAARLVRDEGRSQEAVRGEGPLDPTAPLLHADYPLSSGVGTPCWCAPEILCGEGYGTPADVYRYSSSQ